MVATTDRLELALRLARRVSEGNGFLAGIERQVRDLGKMYGEPMIGSGRLVFDAGDHVYKVPYTDAGLAANAREANWRGEEIPLADCEFVTCDRRDSVMVLCMEKVEPLVGDRSGLPDWVGEVDGAQVGLDRRGRLVAYDL